MDFNHYPETYSTTEKMIKIVFGMLQPTKKNSEVKSSLGTDTKSRSFAIQRENRFNNLNNSNLIDYDL